jgi:hypothetical protein
MVLFKIQKDEKGTPSETRSLLWLTFFYGSALAVFLEGTKMNFLIFFSMSP